MASIMDFLDDWLDNNERAEQTHKLPNGRDIGNAVQGALALADSQGEALSYQHLKAILRMSHEFDKVKILLSYFEALVLCSILYILWGKILDLVSN